MINTTTETPIIAAYVKRSNVNEGTSNIPNNIIFVIFENIGMFLIYNYCSVVESILKGPEPK